MIVQAPSPEVRAAATAEMAAGMRALPADMIERVDDSDAELRDFLRAHRHLFVSLADLRAARDALARRLHDAKLKGEPALHRFGRRRGQRRRQRDRQRRQDAR